MTPPDVLRSSAGARYQLLSTFDQSTDLWRRSLALATHALRATPLVVLEVLDVPWEDDTYALKFDEIFGLLTHFEHPGVLRVLDAGALFLDPPATPPETSRAAYRSPAATAHSPTEQRPFVAIECVQGVPLTAPLDLAEHSAQPLGVDYALCIGAQTARALAYLHVLRDADARPLNVTVRDLSPQKLFVTLDGVVKVIPSTVRWHRATAQARETYKDWVRFVAPERLADRASSAADLYSLGAMLWEMVTGQRIFSGRSGPEVMLAVIERTPQRAAALNPQIPAALDTLIHTLLEKDPASRPTDALSIADALEQMLRERGVLEPARLIAECTSQWMSASRAGPLRDWASFPRISDP